MKEPRSERRYARSHLYAAAALLMVGSPVVAGTITCRDQVGALKAKLADHPDKALREQLDDAERLCRERKDTEALELVEEARAAISAQQPSAVAGPDSTRRK